MANTDHLAILRKGKRKWDLWRADNPRVVPNLSRADLLLEDLHSFDLSGARLVKANLQQADLSFADLNGADLTGANLNYANLSESFMIDTKLRKADLSTANLYWAQFNNTDFTEAVVGNTIFANSNLNWAIGLETVEHRGPSSIGIDAIYISNGKIPHVFLRGAGVPEVFISYMESLNFAGIEFYSLFISYSTKDQEFAERLRTDLRAKGVRCWFAPYDIRSGKKLHEQIDEAIRVHDKLLLILSPASMESEWVKTEISKARKMEIKEGRRVLYPIRLCPFGMLRDWECFDADAGKDSAREIREYFIPDFSNWKNHDAYMLAFDSLLRDLQGEPSSQNRSNDLLNPIEI